MNERPRRWRRRLPVLVLAVVGLIGIAIAVATGLEGSLTYYRTPTELRAQAATSTDHAVRLGGLVVQDSVLRRGTTIAFTVTDGAHDVPVVSQDQPPGTFREGKGVVVEGHMTSKGVFDADRIIVRHSNEYRPPKSDG